MYSNRVLFGSAAFIVLLIFIVIIFAAGGGKKQTPTDSTEKLNPLPEYADTNSDVSLNYDGIVNGEDLHRSIRITVSDSARKLDIIKGYSDDVLETKTFSNSSDAYRVFLKAIDGYGFLSKNHDSKAPANPEGQCPLGYRYIYTLDENDMTVSTSWASTCGSSVGNSAGNPSSLLTLFQDQIPNYYSLTSQVNLSATTTSTSGSSLF